MSNLRKQRFATLYVTGITAGDWQASAELAGYKTPPSLDDAEVRQLIGALGGVVPESFEPYVPEAAEVPDSTIAKALEGLSLPLPDDPERLSKTKELIAKLQPIYMTIATGLSEANPTQRMVLKDMLDRAYKALESDTSAEITHEPIIFLPLRSDQAGAHIARYTSLTCPHCGGKIEFTREEDNDDAVDNPTGPVGA